MYWTVIYFGQFFLIADVAKIFLVIFPRIKICINFDKKPTDWAILGDFLTKSSGHPASKYATRGEN
jgi:hypothetical protein